MTTQRAESAHGSDEVSDEGRQAARSRHPEVESGDQQEAGGHRRRNAADTRKLLLEAACVRFAQLGFQATKLRDVSDDAGVNVALVSRYFGSKEGLFRACLVVSVDDLDDAFPAAQAHEDKLVLFAHRLAGPNVNTYSNRLGLLLRSSQDPQAEQIRVDLLRSFAEKLADIGKLGPHAPDRDSLLLNAQIALSAGLGVALMRSSLALEPLASSAPEDLVGPLLRLIRTLLDPT